MANDQNLRPFNTLPADRHRELSRKGGVASGEARRAKRDLVEREKIVRAADHALYKDSLDIMAECAKLLKLTRPKYR